MYKELTAIEAKYEAQKIAFAPFYFQATLCLKELGIIELVAKARTGISVAEIVEKTGLKLYAVKVLVEAGLCNNIFKEEVPGKLTLTKIGRCVRSDRMTEVNMNFTNDVCYEGLFRLKDSLINGKPEGLKVFGDWRTIYEGLSQLPEKAKKSWFDFDHFYSDGVFPYALKIVFSESVGKMIDIGGNTGKWATACCEYNEKVEVTMLDLPGQLDVAKAKHADKPFKDRIKYHEINLLDESQPIPKGADAVWMSQFLDCFGSDEILSILKRVYDAVDEQAFVYILEPYWDNQRFPASSFSLVGTSLYFTCMANGNSKMFHSEEMEQLTTDTGFELVETFELIGDSYHTLLKIRKRS